MKISVSINISQPLWIGTGSLVQVRGEVSSYSQTVDVEGGYATCDLQLSGDKESAEDWLYNYIGAHVECYGSGLNKIWEGFINEVSLNLGGLDITRGPLLDVANTVTVKYQTPSYSFPAAGVTIGGDQQVTTPITDATSIERYGTREKILSAGTASTTQADQVAQVYLNENISPPTKQQVSIGGSGGRLGIKISCLGYRELMDYVPDNTASGTGTMDLSTKIEELIGKNPDSIFSTDYTGIESNTTQVGKYYEEDQTALAIMKSLVALGDASDSRYTWGVYEDRKVRYEAIPTTWEYELRLGDQGSNIIAYGGSVVYPWDVLPGKFLFVSDFLVGRVIPSTLREDPRMMFIESVDYTAPDSLRLNGSRVDTLKQKLAKLNLGGM